MRATSLGPTNIAGMLARYAGNLDTARLDFFAWQSKPARCDPQGATATTYCFSPYPDL
jgi:hypothetical protein